ncbi:MULTISPECIES: hypothetical protein [Halocynthiibacter]|uniref:Uncharacterized protein n=1 Tax=Halocynthiibacter halioticoli TaxID=2986804 RepID=A0AAE3IXZ2_9RHOB|nr:MULTISPECIES: hypothetical protein [Halocynthiibacter]MCV6823804.1 hypothetical protein [Halocynthiibacter halioticoli]MCW4056805.1 hypothetical protein [Halocynthiibacter sp. SDUM655004]
MVNELPELYFRIRDNGAAVFRINTENRQRRIEMQQIAVVNTRNGEIKPHGGRSLTEHETTEISDWLRARQELLAAREKDEIHRVVDTLNRTAHWAQSNKASPEALEEVTDSLLLAMHDLRAVLVRRKAERLTDGAKDD